MNIRNSFRTRHVHRLLFCALAGLLGAGIPGTSSETQPVSSPPIDTQESFGALMADADSRMMQAMHAAPRNGQPDHDFAAMMIPHHQGAIDMAKAELLYGKNPVLRRIAQEIIVTQQQEIVVMRLQLEQLDKAAPSRPFPQQPVESGDTP